MYLFTMAHWVCWQQTYFIATYRRWFVFINCNICTTGQARFLQGFSRLNGIFFFVVYMCSIFANLKTNASHMNLICMFTIYLSLVFLSYRNSLFNQGEKWGLYVGSQFTLFPSLVLEFLHTSMYCYHNISSG